MKKKKFKDIGSYPQHEDNDDNCWCEPVPVKVTDVERLRFYGIELEDLEEFELEEIIWIHRPPH